MTIYLLPVYLINLLTRATFIEAIEGVQGGRAIVNEWPRYVQT